VEEGGQERAALRGRAARDHVGELADLERKKRGPQREGDDGEEIDGQGAPRIDRKHISPQRIVEARRQPVSIATLT